MRKKKSIKFIRHLLQQQTENDNRRYNRGKNLQGKSKIKKYIYIYIKQIMEDMNSRTYEQVKWKAERRSEWRIAANQSKDGRPKNNNLITMDQFVTLYITYLDFLGIFSIVIPFNFQPRTNFCSCSQ